MTYTVANYIVDRLAALGARHVFQVPGNYCAEFLSAANDSGKINCIGTTNELEAGYAADACARLTGIGVACVTYGVGSFSALNAIAGAYVEYCPVVLINGTARESKAVQLVQQGVLFAHAIDTIRTDESIYRSVTAATAVITSGEDAPDEIDRVLRTLLTTGRPVYLEVRDQVWSQACAAPARPEVPLAPFCPSQQESADIDQAVNAAAAVVAELILGAKKPVLWGGEGLQRRKLQKPFARLVELTRLPYTTTLMAKSLLPENHEQFIGVYDSKFAAERIRKVVEDTDLLVALGTILGDFYGPVVAKSYDGMVLAATDAVRTGSKLFPNVPLHRFLPKLISKIESLQGEKPSQHVYPAGFEELRASRRAGFAPQVDEEKPIDPGADSTELTWDNFFARIATFITAKMLVMVDTSLALFPAAGVPVLRADHFVAQTVWLSIGYTMGAAVGASQVIGKDERVITFVGDGGFQMMPQALSTMARLNNPVIVFILDNQIYGIEQFLIDPTYYADNQKAPLFFNQLKEWDYEKLANAFGVQGAMVRTLGDLEKVLAKLKEVADQPALINVKLSAKDLPQAIRSEMFKSASLAAGETAAPVGGRVALAGFD
jgi:indolepyruvate decarboxylase